MLASAGDPIQHLGAPKAKTEVSLRAGDPLSSGNAMYNLSISADPFAFTVSRSNAARGDAPLFDTTGHRLVFKVSCFLTPSSCRLICHICSTDAGI